MHPAPNDASISGPDSPLPTVSASTSNKSRPRAARPPLRLLGTEPWRAAREYLKLALLPPRGPRGDGHPVIIFPGLASDSLAVRPLRDHCRRLGYAAFDWGRGFNTGPRGDVDDWMQQLAADLRWMLHGHDEPPSLIGWSLGGLYARELAKLPGFAVRRVITIGTPFNGLPEQTHAAWLYRLLGGTPANAEPHWQRRLRTPPPVPTTSIYSRSDGVVAWQTCRHEPADRQAGGPAAVEDVEVRGSHLGMGWNPQVLRAVAQRLALPAGDLPDRRRAWARALPKNAAAPVLATGPA